MNEDNLKLAQKDIDEAVKAIEDLEEDLKNADFSKDTVKEKFMFLSQKLQELEAVLKTEGII
jgi:putative IMPACT (imprinted ancient) family translation regulator